ncbi:MAG: hypothetical protein EXR71_20820 [Myxococcales bacterium]|nr:hypothetical protein [Myxococcales bacterium]
MSGGRSSRVASRATVSAPMTHSLTPRGLISPTLALFVWLSACSEIVALPALQVNLTAVEFGAIAAGESVSMEVSLSNPGAADLALRELRVTGDARFALEGDAPDTVCAGCVVPLVLRFTADGAGEAFGALLIEAESGPWPTDGWIPERPDQSGDPLNFAQEVVLHGSAPDAPATAFAFVTRVVEAPWHWPDGTSTEHTWTAVNTGNTSVAVLTPTLDQCGPDVAVLAAPNPGLLVFPGESVALTLTHAPADPAAVRCTLTLATDAGVHAEGELWFSPPSFSAPPAVNILSPANGAGLASGSPVEITVSLADDLDTPMTMVVAVYSLVRGEYVLYSRPGNDSGTLNLTVSGNALAAGPDTLTVAAQDWHGNIGFDAISVRVDAPADDDADGDGWGVSDGDCDDARGDIFPDAPEVTDTVDQDCDGRVDEGTPETDDDGDGSGEDDCDDRDTAAFPGGTEAADGIDNDCDGAVDEGTSSGDDDRDGYAEALGDCDDDDTEVGPATAEACNGQDDDCDTDVDEGCPVREPMILALSVVPDACHAGAPLEVKAFVDGELSLAWGSDAGPGESGFAEPSAASTTFTCPDLTDPDHSRTVSLSAIGTDEGGAQAFAIAAVTVVPDSWSLAAEAEVPGCQGSALAWLPMGAVLLGRATTRRASCARAARRRAP